MWLGFFVIVTTFLVDIYSEPLNNILRSLDTELSYKTIFLLQNQNDSLCWNQESLGETLPILNFNASESVYLKDTFNTKILVLVCLAQNETSAMKVIYKNLQDMRDTHTILFAASDALIKDLFLECFGENMLNVLAFKGSDRETVYSYRAYPTFRLIQRSVTEIKRYFEPQLKDLGGYTLKTLPDNVFPRTVSYRSPDGRRQLAGYLSHFIRNYVSTLNATIKICWELVPEEGFTHLALILQLAESAGVEFPLALNGLDLETVKQNIPLEFSSWFLMLPMEPDLPRSRFFTRLQLGAMIPLMVPVAIALGNALQIEAGLGPGLGHSWRYCSRVIGDQVLRGILGQAFVLPGRLSLKLMTIYGLLLMGGFFMNNYYVTVLETWLVHPPVGETIKSLEVFYSLKMKILIIPPEVIYMTERLGTEFMEEHRDMFDVTSSANFQRKRTQMDKSHSYPVTQSLWPLLQQGQVRLQRPIFRKSHEIVFIPFLLLTMSLPDNSPFHKSLLRFSRNTHESGLYHFWRKRSFNELRILRKISYKVDSHEEYCGMNLDDFYYLWLGYAVGTIVSCLGFLLELGYYRWSLKKYTK